MSSLYLSKTKHDRAVHAEHPTAQVTDFHVGAATTSLWLYCSVPISSTTCMLASRCAVDWCTGSERPNVALLTATHSRPWPVAMTK